MSGLTAGSLFTGIGGLDLGLERAGIDVVWQVENNPYCNAILDRRWPDTTRYIDVTNTEWDTVRPVDLLAGGFPCQDISNAHTNGTRLALGGTKSGLWSSFRDAIAALRPGWVIVENVAAPERWLSDVRSDLAGYGYASVPLELSAGTFGAPHRRPRVFVVANADGEGEPLRAIHAEVAGLSPVPRADGDWRSSPPGGFRVDDGAPAGMDRCRVLGNAVVPHVAEWIGRRIVACSSREQAA
jgi:DNA (cytosine-5)-methyltransferase 1